MENESISALQYIHSASIGEAEHCKSESKLIFEWLEKEYNNKTIEGCNVYIIRNTKTIEDNILLIQYKKVTGDRFPFLYVAIQPYTTDSIPGFETTMLSLGYTKVEPLQNWEQADDLWNQ